MRLATWNINGVKARLDSVLAWLREAHPDVACFQEIKSTEEAFPGDLFMEAGYNYHVQGQKGFNGVAILSRTPLDVVTKTLPGDEADDQARYIEATVRFGTSALRVCNLYLPNGNPIGTDKFAYKLAWMRRLERHVVDLLDEGVSFLLAGDFNIIPEPVDAKVPEAWTNDALFQPESREAYRRLLNLGLIDAVRATAPGPGIYTFWDYQGGAYQKNHGIRIDHLLLSPDVADRLVAAGVDAHVRGWERPSDHVPVWVELQD